MSAPPFPRPRGLSLIELLAALLALATLALLAMPPLISSIATLNADLLRWQLHTTLATARNTAIVQRRLIGSCPSADGRTCSDDWSAGWLLFRLPPGADLKAPVAVPAEDVLRHHRGSQTRRISARVSKGRPTLRFRSDGRASSSNATISICVGSRLHSELTINIAGRIRSARRTKATPCPTP